MSEVFDQNPLTQHHERESMTDLKLTPPDRKLPRHVTIALNHMRKQKDALTKKIEKMTAERDGLDAAILAIDK